MNCNTLKLMVAVASFPIAHAIVACRAPKAPTPPEPPVAQTTPPELELAPVHFPPAPPAATTPNPIDPPPEVLKVRDDGRG